MRTDISFNINVIPFDDFFQFHIDIGFVDGLGSISIEEDVLVGVGYYHSGLYPVDNLFEVGVDFDPSGLSGFLFLNSQDIRFKLTEP